MHCSANVDDEGRVAIFFGLSGTGKTTLSADPERHLIGDDEHGWGDAGVFNIEGGCYAKVIRLSAEAEPEIYGTTRTLGTVLENVVVDERGVLDLDDDSKTENTRAAYKLEQIGNALPAKRAGHPSSIVFLTADAFGILPPIARLTRDQALFYFLSGFTAKLAGTEIGVEEPQPTFSACFGAPFLPQALRPSTPGMLGEKLDAHPHVNVWLVNTGWTGGPYGEGERMPIAATRQLLRAALEEGLDDVEYRVDPIFGFEVPVDVPESIAASSTRARRGPTPRPTTRRRGSWPERCSGELRALRRRERGRPPPASAPAPSAPEPFRIASPGVEAKHDVLIVGAGLRRHARRYRGVRRGRGRRGHLQDPSHPEPLRRGRGRHQRGARERLRGRPGEARLRHGQGLRLPRRPGRDRGPLPGGAGRRLPARALGRRLLADGRRPDRAAPVRRRRRAAHRVRGRHHRPRPRPRPLRADDEARRQDVRGVVRVAARRGRRPLPGRHLLGSPRRRAQARGREDRDPLHRAAPGGSTRARRTPTPAPATAWRSRSGWACR